MKWVSGKGVNDAMAGRRSVSISNHKRIRPETDLRSFPNYGLQMVDRIANDSEDRSQVITRTSDLGLSRYEEITVLYNAHVNVPLLQVNMVYGLRKNRRAVEASPEVHIWMRLKLL